MTESSIVITGLSLRLPGAVDQEQFWKLLLDGVDRTDTVSARRRELARAPGWNDTIGEVDDIELFDADFFGIEADEAKFMDPQHRIVMELAYDAMCDAGLLESGHMKDRRYSVYTAICTNSYYPMVCRYMDEKGIDNLHPRTIMNSINSALAARVSHQYNLTGPVMAVDTACSSFLTALATAADSIRVQNCEGAVVAGVNLLSAAYSTMLCNCGGITTSHPYTRVFDEEADGTLIGEGAVVCVLEREDVARRRNRKIYGRILGYAINNDGSSLNIMAPNPRGQGNVIRDCYATGIDHTRIGYIETHGTGTRIGDPIELNALSKVYKKADFGDSKIGIGSVKTNIGHLLAAAGGAGLAKLLLSLRNGRMAPNLHLRNLNPLLQLEDTPFEVVTEPRPWPRDADQPRVGAITSLGLGGTNVHFVIEEGDPERTGGRLSEPLLCLSAKTEEALRHMIDDVSDLLTRPDVDAYNLAMTLARFRPAHDWRAVVRFDPDSGVPTEVRVQSQERTVRRALLRQTPATMTREQFFRDALLGKVQISDAEPGRTEIALAVGQHPDAQTLVVDPGLSPLETAAELFVNGCPVNWEHFFPDQTGTIRTLAPYPFSKKPHWLDF
ncbi:ketoacyl-synthetase-like protein [Stackebrandtia endophytica]|uniref:Ketoacyl-synthetase-like protein n=1 Tax=Stackebrandtia endophytica TaxID=1496996 RepID=A0A543AVY7_9ACTN|nr:polyketide synthase [Stackebrandtia endophytica]TQL76702.1 ketoacyl-synthetase-like protein [Stackebrandtia endophytica]